MKARKAKIMCRHIMSLTAMALALTLFFPSATVAQQLNTVDPNYPDCPTCTALGLTFPPLLALPLPSVLNEEFLAPCDVPLLFGLLRRCAPNRSTPLGGSQVLDVVLGQTAK